ncbi:MAG TPA: beta-L-arabinofuranosidase domain-containing protein [Terriglobia bacterium]|nr:beta-L-arabinofuranosidase domain-containing protein [Terriglobia bacterium]
MNNRRDFMKKVAGAAVAPYFLGRAASGDTQFPAQHISNIPIRLEPFDYTGVRLLDGMLKDQYVATRNFYFNIPDDDILVGFRKRDGLPAPGHDLPGWYEHDIFNTFGQWLSGMARMYKATGDDAILDKATKLMNGWGKTIDPDGYFYYSHDPIRPHYTYEKTVCGLVDLYHFGGQKDALPLLDRITDWAIKNLDRGRKNPTSTDIASGGTEWYTLCENLYRAYQFTGDSKYKTFGDLWRYTHYWDMFNGDVEPTPYGFHAYSHVNTLSSAAMTYAITGDTKYLKTITNAYDWFMRTQFYATGGWGPTERLQAPDGSLGKSLETTVASFETPCCSWACFKLGKYLLQFTGEARYGDWMEKMVYNGIGAALPMSGRGDTFYYSDYNLGGAHKVYFHMSFPCCSGTYSQAVPDYHDIIYFKDPDTLYVNLFVPSEVTWNYQGHNISVKQETDYPESDTTTLSINPGNEQAFGLKFRVPEWCSGASVQVNGSKQDISCRPGNWATIQRVWHPGDQATIRIPSSLRLAPIDQQHPNRVAAMIGPVVLVRLHATTMAVRRTDPSEWMRPSGQSLEYKVPLQPPGKFVPFYKVQNLTTGYGMYFDLET